MNPDHLPAPITSADNPQFKALKKLLGSGRERRKAGQTLLDGIHLIDAWLAAGHNLCGSSPAGRPLHNLQKTVLSAAGARRPDHVAWLQAHPELRTIVLADALFAQLADGDEVPSGLLALVDIPVATAAPRTDRDTLVLDGVQDPGNLGSILRSAAAAGFAQAVLSADCAQAWSPRVLRAGMGAHFVIAVHEAIDLPSWLPTFQGSVAVTHLAGATPLYAARLGAPLAWVFGSEGQGVRDAVLACASQRISIPMPGAVESLNVAAAAAVCLFETTRQRQASA